MLSCVGRFLPADSANIHIFLQSMLNWNIISSYIKVIIILTEGRKKWMTTTEVNPKSFLSNFWGTLQKYRIL